jgi:CheY-like chemotaxis protein
MAKKILLIEDEFYIRELYKNILESAGFNVSVAVDGEEGYKLAQNLPDLILLDVMLPKLNGIMLLKKIKKDKKIQNIPVVLLTNLGQESIIKEAFAEGASGYYLKVKLNPNQIVSQISRFLEDPTLKMNPDTIAFD